MYAKPIPIIPKLEAPNIRARYADATKPITLPAMSPPNNTNMFLAVFFNLITFYFIP
jgi:hypothetical protein